MLLSQSPIWLLCSLVFRFLQAIKALNTDLSPWMKNCIIICKLSVRMHWCIILCAFYPQTCELCGRLCSPAVKRCPSPGCPHIFKKKLKDWETLGKKKKTNPTDQRVYLEYRVKFPILLLTCVLIWVYSNISWNILMSLHLWVCKTNELNLSLPWCIFYPLVR